MGIEMEKMMDTALVFSGVDFPESYLMSITISSYRIELVILSDVSGFIDIKETESALKYLRFEFFGVENFHSETKKNVFLPEYDRDKSTDLGSIDDFVAEESISECGRIRTGQIKCRWGYGAFEFRYSKCEIVELDAGLFED